MSYRRITDAEYSLINRLLSFRESGRNETLIQVGEYVQEIDKEGSLKFAHSIENRRLEHKKNPVEAQSLDLDEIWIHALLFTIDDQVDELEIYKDDSSPIIRMPNPNEWGIIDLY